MSSRSFTLEQVKKHNREDDCWIVVNGDVIDCTKYLPNHPGGSLAITAFAGTECSLEFNTVHDSNLMSQYQNLIVGKVSEGITMEEVARHREPDDCWVVINGEVLDVTEYLKEHPGGQLSITAFGGTDCSLEYNTVHAKSLIEETCPQCVIGKLFVAPKKKKKSKKSTGLSLEDVAKHNTKDDCWVAVNGFVLAVTPFLDEHPGGPEAILRYAGKDATEEWNMIHSFDILQQYGSKYMVGKLGEPLGGTTEPGLTVDEVAKHCTKADCWVIINGMVYNLTEWLPLHPGGETVIMTYAGKDASDEWNMIHPPDTIEKYGKKYELGPVAGEGGDEVNGDLLDEDEVAKHNTEKDCWIILDGIVYDVTKWLPIHPGGVAAILAYAGKDGTEQFNMIHPEGTMNKYGKAYFVGELGAPKPNADTGGGLSAPLLAKGEAPVNQWWGAERNTANRYGPLGPSVSHGTCQALGGIVGLVGMFLYEVFATIFSVKNYKVIHDKSGLTRSAVFLLFFTMIHGLGNLHVFAGAPHFNAYGYFLNRPVPWSTLMLPVEIYLLLCGVMHVTVAIVRTFKFKKISMGVDQLWMIISGCFLLAFLIPHLMQFRFVSEAAAPQYYFRTKWMYPFYCSSDDTSCSIVHFKDLYKMEFQLFASPFWVCYYIIGVLFFISHVREGLRKVINSHPVIPRAYKGAANTVGQILVVFVGLCYLSFPIFCYFSPSRDWDAYEAKQARLMNPE